jgi:SNF2 family DNA or RNA helicase
MRTTVDLLYGTVPYEHQREALETAWGTPAFAYFMEQGTGKSKIIIDETINMIERDLINCVVILAPNQVHENWKEQYEIHGGASNKYTVQVYKSVSTPRAREKQEQWTREIIASGKVLVFLMNIEALSHPSGQNYLMRILRARKNTYMCIDESHKIKNFSAKRTKIAIQLGLMAKYRRIATGTEAEEGIINLFTQMKFLDWSIIGHKFITSFKSMFCIMGGYEMREIVGYRNQQVLTARMAPYVFMKRKRECLDLPDKVYVEHHIEMTADQANIYRIMEEELILMLDDGKFIDVTMVLTRLLKLQQLLCGHLSNEDGTRTIESNRADYVAGLVENASGKSIVFCRFVKDVELVVKALGNIGIVSIGVTGETDHRLDQINLWRNDPACRALVITVQTGGTGLTLNEASSTVFYSNSWSATDRLQAEDRNHRIGQTDKVTYHDVIVKGKIDERILKALKDKSNLADRFRSLISEGRAKNAADFLRED